MTDEGSRWRRFELLAFGLLCGLTSPLPAHAQCDDRGSFDSVYAEAWGIDKRNTRYQPRSSLNSTNAKRLALKWVYGLAQETPRFYPFDLATGAALWYLPTIEQPATQTGRHFLLVEKHGPSGASVWSAPAYDEERGLLYFGTGQNFSHPTTGTSDALFAVSAQSGEIAWVRQFTANDAYTAACNIAALNHPNCPDPMGPDVDFGAPAVLTRTRSGRPLLLAGQKSADVHAVVPDTGERVWIRKLGRGGIIGGVHWGLAVNERQGLAFVPVSDKALAGFPAPGKPAPGLYALDLETGAVRWSYTRESRCSDRECVFGLSAAAVAANDIVVSGSMDGYLMVHQAASGELLWEHDAWGVTAKLRMESRLGRCALHTAIA